MGRAEVQCTMYKGQIKVKRRQKMKTTTPPYMVKYTESGDCVYHIPSHKAAAFFTAAHPNAPAAAAAECRRLNAAAESGEPVPYDTGHPLALPAAVAVCSLILGAAITVAAVLLRM